MVADVLTKKRSNLEAVKGARFAAAREYLLHTSRMETDTDLAQAKIMGIFDQVEAAVATSSLHEFSEEGMQSSEEWREAFVTLGRSLVSTSAPAKEPEPAPPEIVGGGGGRSRRGG